MMSKKILVVEDDPDSADVLEAYLKKEGFLVAVAGDGVRALRIHAEWKPDLVLLDVMLPQLGGTEVLSAIRQAGHTPVIMVSAIGDEPEKIGALRYGADDYIVKPYSPKEVVARVYAVLRRVQTAALPNGVLTHGPLSLDPGAFVATIRNPQGLPVPLELTPTEFNLLRVLLRTPMKAFTRSELFSSCMPDSDALERVVDTHIHNLRRKLEVRGLSGVLVTVRAIGYRFQ